MKKMLMTLAVLSFMFACGATVTPVGVPDPISNPSSEAKPIEITAEDFKIQIADYTSEEWKFLGDKPAIVDFYATWCGPCKQIAPILKDIAKQYDGRIVIYKVDVDDEPELASAFNIQSIPTILFIPMGDKMPFIEKGAMGKDDFIKIIETKLLAQ